MTAVMATKYKTAAWLSSLFLVIAIMLAWLVLPVTDWVSGLSDQILAWGWWGVFVFALIYVIVVVVLAPAEIMSIAAGFIFGAWGFVVVTISATVGATLAFLISRYFVAERVRALARKRPLLEAIDKAIKEDGWKIVVLLRLNPLVPFGLQNYFFGATSIPILPYCFATFFGIMPGSAMYVYIGTLGRAATHGESHSFPKLALLAVGLLATAALIVIVARKAKARLGAIGIDDERGTKR